MVASLETLLCVEATDKLDPRNIMDAEGIKKITDLTAREHILSNDITREKEKTIKKQDVEAREAILALERQQVEAEGREPAVREGRRRHRVAGGAGLEVDEPEHAMVCVDLDDGRVSWPIVDVVLRQRAERPWGACSATVRASSGWKGRYIIVCEVCWT